MKNYMNKLILYRGQLSFVLLSRIFLCVIVFPFIGQSQNLQINDFTSSNLPIIVIETNGQEIVDEPKIAATMGIINNGPGIRNEITDEFNDFYGTIGIELRGNSTQNIFPKKPYLIETRDSLGENLNVSLLDMPEENDWILLASYIDRTFIRDPLAHFLSTFTGQWSSRSRFCEVVINGEYLGVYILIEKIKRDNDRVDIKKLEADDTTSEKITGGYIYEVTGFGGSMGVDKELHYPKIEDITQQQFDYIKKYDADFRSTMMSPYYADSVNGYSRWIKPESFIDEILVQELMRNSDAYGWSAYFHKNRGEKLEAGPVWDFDQSSGNSSYLEGHKTTGWVIGNPLTNSQPAFWKKLFNEDGFNNKLRIRWNELREDKFSDEKILSFIDSCTNYLNEGQERNFEKWPILGVYTWRETIGYAERDTYQKEIDYLKNYMVERASWMDEQLKVESTDIDSDGNELLNDFSLEQNYPNPFNPSTVISYTISGSGHVLLKVFDVLGNEVGILVNKIQNPGKYSVEFSGERLSSGLYFYRLTSGSSTVTKKMILMK